VARGLVAALALLVLAEGSFRGLLASTDSPAPTLSRATRHLDLTAKLSQRVVTPGTRLSLTVDVKPKDGMHVYAPGTEYRAITVELEPNALIEVQETVYPKATTYLFKPLNEHVLVYHRPFRLALHIMVGSRAVTGTIGPTSSVVIKGRVMYQACYEKVCYLPASVPFEWSIRLQADRSANQ
jgi:DsbC/DsbD-like thiol-disulfide interchange protein